MGIKSVAIGAAVALIALSVSFLLGAHNERYKANHKLNENIIKAVRSRAGIDEKIKNMDVVALCHELGGVPDQCEQLRGLAENQPGAGYGRLSGR